MSESVEIEWVSIPLSKQDAEKVEQLAINRDMTVQTFLRRVVRDRIQKELDPTSEK